MKTDVMEPPQVDEDEPQRFSTRRLVRWVTILFLGILAVLALWQEPLHAGWR
ncbi:hypothetical protein [Jidongwangia harbinensis]|uniref:hypothetical protein n=1 Tax=Jidongwangia harbinensis TaxID=2878561 RepID=UPI001CD9E2DD|nr:hypothetical protein [Jidongwangia harbinensis]MCA2214735.1 hypothetical protein [Jidongwangia harbinensis]